MPFEKLSKAELAGAGAAGRRVVPAEYVAFIRGLRPGEGGRAVLADEGVASKVTMKARLEAAAQTAGVSLRFLRSPAGEVKFEVPTAE